MSTNLMQASHQWASRPADERFWNLHEMYMHLKNEREMSGEAELSLKSLTAKADHNNEICLVGPRGNPARLTHWSFGQVSLKAAAPAGYLRELPAPLAATCLNYGIQKGEDTTMQLLLKKNGDLYARSITTDKYDRIWNADILEKMTPLLDDGWMTPPARPSVNDPRARKATKADIVPGQEAFGLSIKEGDEIAPAGCYAGDRDMFVFLVNPQRIISAGSEDGLMRGMFVLNSEVGAQAFKVFSFYLETVCGNHICWGATELKELKIVHKGNANARFGRELVMRLRKYNDMGTVEEEKMITLAKNCELGKTREEVIATVFGNKSIGLTKDTVDNSYDYAVKFEHTAKASPNTVWGLVHGLTRYSQTKKYADEKFKLDTAGGKLLQLAYKKG